MTFAPNETPWLSLFDELHRVVVGVGALLRDADRLMSRAGFRTAHSINTAGTESSFHMEQPEKWMAGWFGRFYQHDDWPAVIPYVAVFLHDRGGTEDYPHPQGSRLAEPLVIGGIIRSATAERCSWSYWHCKYWFWMAGVVGGDIAVATFAENNRDGQASNHSFAVRLDDIRSLDDVGFNVVDRVIQLATA